MSGKHAKIFGGAAASLLILGCLGFGFFKYLSPPPVQSIRVPVTPRTPVPSPVARSLPVRLNIPKIQVDADIKALGVTPAGAMDVPSNVEEVGWYKYGPYPGEAGNAVIAGHFGTLKGKQSVFSNLKKLGKGDILSVTDDAGHTTSYAVREMRVYRETDSASDVFGAPGGAHLNLITCTGPWNRIKKHYAQRLVVFTDKVDGL